MNPHSADNKKLAAETILLTLIYPPSQKKQNVTHGKFSRDSCYLSA